MPAAQLDSGITAGFALGFTFVPTEPGFAVADSGFENGCAMPVDVAAGAVSGRNWRRVDVNVRVREAELLRADARRIQRVQIMVAVRYYWRGV